MSKLANQWIEIFRAGDYGEQGSFSEADLDRVVANYQPGSGHEAPVVIGHPKDNGPAFGWVDAIKRSGNVLLAKMKDVQPQFEEMVQQRMFPKRSASFYKTADGKGIQALRHVGFLGAMPPVVKGLADCKFADSEAEPLVLEFQENDMADVNEQSIVEKVVAGLREYFKKGGEPVPAASFSEADATRVAAAAVAAAVEPLKTQLAVTEQKLAAAEAKFSERETKIATTETEQRAQAAIAGLKAKNRWVPAFEKLGLVALFSELAKQTAVVEFGEGAEKKSETPLQILAEFMEQLPAIVPAGETYRGQVPGSPSVPKGVNAATVGVDQNSLRLDQAAKDFAEKNKVDYAVAITEVLKKNPELGVPGGAAIGQA